MHETSSRITDTDRPGTVPTAITLNGSRMNIAGRYRGPSVRIMPLILAVCLTAGSAAAQRRLPTSESVFLESKPGRLAGTLLVPVGAGRVPLAIIIAGSGPTDRDGNTAGEPSGPNCLRQLADGLAAKGIAVLRYDKRGIAGSGSAGVPEQNLRFDMLADDAVAWARKYEKDPRFSRIIVIGHSEGSLLGMLASQRFPVAGFVSIAGTGRRADKVLHDQLAAQLTPAMLKTADNLMAALVAGKTAANAPPELFTLFRPSVQPYLISWFKHTGTVEIARLRVPVLIAQGTHDIQVAPAEADALQRALPAARMLKIAGMNHVLKRTAAGRAEQTAAYSDPTLPIVPELVNGIAAFINGLK